MSAPRPRIVPVPPEKGSFPLDHDSICGDHVLTYFNCMRETKNYNENKCRMIVKDYFKCRMSNNLMKEESFEDLGLRTHEDIAAERAQKQ